MKWKGRNKGRYIEDRRSGRGRRTGGGMRRASGSISLGTIIFVAIYLMMGGDLGSVLQLVLSNGGASSPYNNREQGQEMPRNNQRPHQPMANTQEEEVKAFIDVIKGDLEQTWNSVFQNELGIRYKPATLVYFHDIVRSGCGTTPSHVGPFYCPLDGKAYIDLDFYNEMKRMGAHGDFAQAYVIAHEIGHHVQNLQGISLQVQKMKRRLPQREANALSVKTELQADCYAGVWAHFARRYKNMLEQGDIEEGLRAASAIGDDNMQKRAGHWVNEESFTHGSGEQRMSWFMQGMKSGQMKSCDTFN